MNMPNPPPSAASESAQKEQPPVHTTSGEPAQVYQPSNPVAAELPYPVTARGLALTILCVLGLMFALQWSMRFLVPMALGVMVSFTLNPVVNWLERWHIHRLAGTVLVLALLLAGLVTGADRLRGEFQSIVVQLPEATRQLAAQVLSSSDGSPSAIEQVQKAASEIENAATPGGDGEKAPPKQAAPARLPVSEWLWAGSMGALEFVGQATMVIFLVFFLLLSGDTFKRKLVKLTGPSLANKRITVQMLDEIIIAVQRYMFMLLVTNSSLALLMWVALRWIGLENSGAWAVVAGFLHIIPYFGPLLVTLSTGLTAFMQFHSISTALLTAAASLAIATFIGIFVTTWMTGKIARMNPTAVFVGLLFWGWLWGVWGLLLGIPIIVVVKVVAEHVEEMHGVAELLSD